MRPFTMSRPKKAGDAIGRLIEDHPELRGNEHEMGAFYRAEALSIIRAHPKRYLQLSLLRFLGVWTPVRDYRLDRLPAEIGILGAANLVLLALAVATALRRRLVSPRVLLPIVLLIACYTVGHMLVNARMRYVGPLIPLVVVLAAEQILPRRAPLVEPST